MTIGNNTVLRDDNVFRYLSDEPLAVIPAGASEPLDLRTAPEKVAERKRWIDNSHQCPTCSGLGRVAKA